MLSVREVVLVHVVVFALLLALIVPFAGLAALMGGLLAFGLVLGMNLLMMWL